MIICILYGMGAWEDKYEVYKNQPSSEQSNRTDRQHTSNIAYILQKPWCKKLPKNYAF